MLWMSLIMISGCLCILLLCGPIYLTDSMFLLIPNSYAHFDHLTHYNGGGIGLSKYYVNEQVEPEYIHPNDPAQISFSIQDRNGNDVNNILAMIEIYEANTGERMKVYPWTKHDTGDFAIYYTFPNLGMYQIVVSIANDPSHINSLNTEPARDILGNTFNCNCSRAIFNVAVSENFGSIFDTVIFGAIIGAITLFALILGLTYIRRKKSGLYPMLTNNEVVKYSVMLLALSAGLIHLAVFSEHGSLRIEYSIFLLSAGGSQVAYGLLYILVTLVNESSTQSKRSANSYYQKTVILNLVGLTGNILLLILYTYAVIFSPPLSPNNRPEEIDFAGVFDKSLELFLVTGILYLMRWERRKLQRLCVSIK